MIDETKQVTFDDVMALHDAAYKACLRMDSELMKVGLLASRYIESSGESHLLSALGQQVGCYRAAEDSHRIADAAVEALHRRKAGQR